MIRSQLVAVGRVPYGGQYAINKPDMGMVGTGTTFDMLEKNVRAYRKANAVPTGLGFSEQLEDEICKLYPQECELCHNKVPLKRRLGSADVLHGTKVLLALKVSGNKLVPREEAERRGEICSRCPLCIRFPTPCGGLCGELKDVVMSIIGGYSTSYDGDLRSCAICACYYSAHIRIPYPILNKGLNDEMREQFEEAHKLYGCWKVP